MKDITLLMLQYRACCKSIWNDFFRHLLSPVNYCDRLDAFDDIAAQLFSAFILSDSDGIRKSPSYNMNCEVLRNIHIRINVPNAPVAISRDLSNSTYWDFPVVTLGDDEASLRFIDFFDFDRQGILVFEYYRVRIVESIYPELIGHDALLKVENCMVEIY